MQIASYIILLVVTLNLEAVRVIKPRECDGLWVNREASRLNRCSQYVGNINTELLRSSKTNEGVCR